MKLAFALGVLLLLGQAAAADWPSFRHDERNTGAPDGTDYAPFEDVWWTVKLKPAPATPQAPVAPTQLEASPVVADGTVIVVDWAKYVRALDAETGREIWNKSMPAKMVGTPAIANGRVFVVDTNGNLKAFDLKRGTELDSATVGATLGSIAIHEGKLFIGNENGEMQAFDTETLTLLWKFNVQNVYERIETTGVAPNQVQNCKDPLPLGQIRGTPAIYQGKVFFGSLNHWFFAVNEQGDPGQKTQLQWMFKSNDIIVSSPMIDHARGRVVVGSYDERVHSFVASPSGAGPVGIPGSGGSTFPCTALKHTPAWTFNVPSSIGNSKVYSSPATDGSKIFFGANNQRVYAIRADTGAHVWNFTTGAQVVSSPAVANGVLVVGSDDSKVYWLNATDGKKLKEFKGSAAFKASPAIDGNNTYIGSFDADVYRFGPAKPPRPDLVIESMSYANNIVRVTVKNQGTLASPPAYLRLTAAGSVLEDVSIPGLAIGEPKTLDLTPSLGTGLQELQAVVDQPDAVVELNEANNRAYHNVTIVAPPVSSAPSLTEEDEGSSLPAGGLLAVLTGVGTALAVRRRKFDD